jgi:hypothetical protein
MVSHIFRPGKPAFKEQVKHVNGFEGYIHALKKKKQSALHIREYIETVRSCTFIYVYLTVSKKPKHYFTE